MQRTTSTRRTKYGRSWRRTPSWVTSSTGSWATTIPLTRSGTWVLCLGARRGGPAAAIPGRPAAAISREKDEPTEIAFILPANSPVAGYWWADLVHGYRGSAQEVAKRWVTRPGTW